MPITNPLTKLYYNLILDLLRPEPLKVIHNQERTIIVFDDGSKVITKPNGDEYDGYIGFCVAMTAKYFGGKKAAHEAYETLSGCKFHKQPEGVAEETQEQFNEKVANFIINVDKTIELLTQKRLAAKQTEQKAEPLPSLQTSEQVLAVEEKTEEQPIKNCWNCRYFALSNYTEPCRSCFSSSNHKSPMKI